jgi:signal transduction histidine kinase
LSGRLFWRLLGIFISLDIAIALIFCVAAIAYCEIEASQELARPSYPHETAETTASGVIVIPPFSWILPSNTRDGQREFIVLHDVYGGSALHYVIHPKSDAAVSFEYDLMGAIRVFRWSMDVLCVIELFMLLSKSVKNSRMLRRALGPISELARATETLSHASETLNSSSDSALGGAPGGGQNSRGKLPETDPKKLAEIRGALDGITAARLDTRIDVGGAQKELRELASAINGMLDRVSAAYSAQRQFVSDASHELRTPIAVIQGYAGLLDRWGKNDEKTLQEAIDAIKSEAETMKRLVEQLLFLARADSDMVQHDVSSFDLAEELATQARMIDDRHTYSLRADPAPVAADRALIKEALRAILDNAAKYTDEGGEITLRTFTDSNRSAISVTDDGAGIAPEILPKIFERFVRADDSRARASGGSGLGLAIARQIVDVSGGRMEAVSRVGFGTRMTIYLPINS